MSTRTRLASIVAALALLAAAPGLAQKGKKGKKGKKTFAETTSVVAVEVPVTVIRDGQPVTGLTIENFEVFDGKTKQVLTDFQVIDLSKIETHDPLRARVPVAARRHFLMFFDMAFSDVTSVVKARDAALDLVDSLHPTDLAGVATYSSNLGARLLLGFTSDRDQLKLAIETLGVPGLVERVADPLTLLFGGLERLGSSESAAGFSSDGLAGADLREARNERILDAVGRITSAERSAQIDKVSAFTGNMEALAQMMASIEGLKHLVYFSEGIPDDVVEDGNFADSFQNTLNAAGNDAVGSGGSTFSTESSTVGQASRVRNQIESMVEQFRRAGCVVQAVDIGGARALNEIGGRQAGEQSLVAMSKDTGGEFFRNFNDLSVAMNKMLERNSVTYLLVFQPAELRLDGEYHRLKVKLTDAPRGTRLSHRSGYYAPASYEETTAGQRQLEAAELVMSDEEGGDLAADVLTATFPVAGERAYVPMLLEIDGPALLEGTGKGPLALELFAYVTNPEGGIYDFFTQSLGLDLAQTEGALKQSGLKYWGHFDLPPGEYTARIMVRDSRNGRYAMRLQPVVVPAFESAGALLLPPMFPEPPGSWLMVREPESRQRDVAYPFIADGNPYIPAAKPAVPAKGRTPFYLRSVNLTGDVEFAGEVVTADGTPVSQAAVKFAAPAAGAVTAELETRGLKPGEYVLKGMATDGSGQSRSSSIRFVVR